MNQNFNPNKHYYQSQLKLLEEIEGKHRTKPALLTVLFAIGSTLIEAAIAFQLLHGKDLRLAIVVSLFPMGVLWTMANYQANHVNLPQHYDELKEQYDHELDL